MNRAEQKFKEIGFWSMFCVRISDMRLLLKYRIGGK